ncbi:hypothetical protein T492DRAFT_1019161 [Pavlovales sp. CCMP2436]|nr:hypothetical protein T492DRAFT_1019161 [Pavlovales sp. CCMP2436]
MGSQTLDRSLRDSSARLQAALRPAALRPAAGANTISTDLAAFRQVRAVQHRQRHDRGAGLRDGGGRDERWLGGGGAGGVAGVRDEEISSLGDSDSLVGEATPLAKPSSSKPSSSKPSAFVSMVEWSEARVFEASLAAARAAAENEHLRAMIVSRGGPDPQADRPRVPRLAQGQGGAVEGQGGVAQRYGVCVGGGGGGLQDSARETFAQRGAAEQRRRRVAESAADAFLEAGRALLPGATHTHQRSAGSSAEPSLRGGAQVGADELALLRARVGQLETQLSQTRNAATRPQGSAWEGGVGGGARGAYPLELLVSSSVGESLQTLRLLRLIQERDGEILRLRHDRAQRLPEPGWGGGEGGGLQPWLVEQWAAEEQRAPFPASPFPASPFPAAPFPASPFHASLATPPARQPAGTLASLLGLRELAARAPAVLGESGTPSPSELRALCAELQLSLGYVLDMLERQTVKFEGLRARELAARLRASD